jgi:outer membrane biosynthesis protein TonB
VVVVSLAEPPQDLAAAGPGWRLRGGKAGATPLGDGKSGSNAGTRKKEGAGVAPRDSDLTFPAPAKFSLSQGTKGDFRLAAVGKSPEPWAIPMGPGPGPAPRRLRYRANAYRPGAAPGEAGGVFLIPFDISEKAVADWTEAVLARIERNWTIPASGRLAFSGRVQITLTVERQGGQRSLVIDDASVPAPLTLAALHAVQASLPLPPLPENVAAESLAFTFVFAYNG